MTVRARNSAGSRAPLEGRSEFLTRQRIESRYAVLPASAIVIGGNER